MSGPGLLRRLAGDSAIYGIGGVANQALAIVLVPVYARALGVTNYGTVAILTTTLSLTTLVATLALPQAFFRSYLKEADDDRERARVLHTAAGLRLIVSLVTLLIFSALSLPLAILLMGSTDDWMLVALLGPIVFFDTLNLVPLSLLRADRRPMLYAAISFSRAVLGSALIVVLVVAFELGVMGVVIGSLVSSLVSATAGVAILVRDGRFGLSMHRPLVRHMLLFSLPLVPASVASWTLNLSDRYLIDLFAGRDAVGLYSAGYTVGLAINALAVAPFTLAWGAAYWEISRHDNAPQIISRVLTGFVAIATFLALGLGALGTDAIRLLLTPAFEEGRYVTPFSAFAYVCYGIFTIVTTGLNLESQTRRVPLIMGLAAIANVLLNVALIPVLGFMGAAISTLASYGLLAASGGIVSQRVYPVPWDLPRVGLLMAMGLGLAGAALIGPDHALWRVGCVALYPALAIGLRLIPRDVLNGLASLRP